MFIIFSYSGVSIKFEAASWFEYSKKGPIRTFLLGGSGWDLSSRRVWGVITVAQPQNRVKTMSNRMYFKCTVRLVLFEIKSTFKVIKINFN